MQIKVERRQGSKRWWADMVDLPGSPPVGDGRTQAEAVACLFSRLLASKPAIDIDYKTLQVNGKFYVYEKGCTR